MQRDKLTVTSYERNELPCISTRCVNYKGSVSDCIKEQEALRKR